MLPFKDRSEFYMTCVFLGHLGKGHYDMDLWSISIDYGKALPAVLVQHGVNNKELLFEMKGTMIKCCNTQHSQLHHLALSCIHGAAAKELRDAFDGMNLSFDDLPQILASVGYDVGRM